MTVGGMGFIPERLLMMMMIMIIADIIILLCLWASRVGRQLGTPGRAARDGTDRHHPGRRSLEWNWPKEAMNRPIWAGIC